MYNIIQVFIINIINAINFIRPLDLSPKEWEKNILLALKLP